MSPSRALTIAIALILVVLLAVGAFALWLFGGDEGTDDELPPAAETGIVPVRVIDAYAGERLLTPVGIGAGSDGGFFVTLRDQATVVEFDSAGNYVQHWGTQGLEPGQLMAPLGVAVDRAGSRVYVTDRSRLRLICFGLDGALRWEQPVLNPLTPATSDSGVVLTTFGPIAVLDAEGVLQGEVGSRGELPGQFDYPRGIAPIGDDGAIVADTNNARVQRIRFSGDVTATVDWVVGRPPLDQDDTTTRFGVPSSVALDDDELVYVLDGFRARVDVLDPETGEDVYAFVFSTGTAPGQLYLPSGIAYLGGSTFAITDTANNRVQIFRLLLPGENNPVSRTPWIWWLLPLLLLPLLFLLGRRRFFVTEETLRRAEQDGRLRLLAAVLKRMHVLPGVYESYKDIREDDVSIGDYLLALPTASVDAQDDEEALAAQARPTGLQRLLLRRHIVVCADEAQCERFTEQGMRVRAYEDLAREYELDGRART